MQLETIFDDCSFPEFLVESDLSAVKSISRRIAAIVFEELVVFPVQGELSVSDSICISPDEAAEEFRLRWVFFYVVKAGDDVVPFPVFVFSLKSLKKLKLLSVFCFNFNFESGELGRL